MIQCPRQFYFGGQLFSLKTFQCSFKGRLKLFEGLNFVGLDHLRFAQRILSEKAMAPHSSSLAWKIPWTEEPGRLQSMGSLTVGHD